MSVPLHCAGALLGVKSWIHQQDYQVGLANRLMAPFADTITVALEKNLSAFNKNKTVRRSYFSYTKFLDFKLLKQS